MDYCPTCRRKVGTNWASPRVLYTITHKGTAALRAWESKK